VKIRKCCYRKNEKGEAMLITTILLLVLVIIVGTTMNVSGMQWDMAYMQKNTSNTYYLAKSGVEKGIDVINKAIQAQIPTILEEARKTYLTKATDRDEVKAIANQSESSFYKDDGLKYQTDEKKIIIDKESLSNFIEKEICNFLKKSFFDNTSSKIVYEVKGDGQAEEGLTTLIDIAFIIKPEVDEEVIDLENFVIRCEAQVGGESNPKDTKVVEATLTIDIPNEISNEIHEAYNWLYNPAEIVDSALTCFSDVVITNGAQLIVKGDIRVKGMVKETTVDTATGIIDAPEMDEFGGIVVSNGGKLKVEPPFGTAGAILSGSGSVYGRQGNVMISSKKPFLAPAATGGAEDNHTSNTGNIYCVSNVATTNGWALDPNNSSNTLAGNYNLVTSLEVEGDIIANALSIYDDFYAGGKNQSPFNWMRAVANNKIHVKGNVFVDNDVRIDEYVKESNIIVGGSIFGISDGTIGSKLEISRDPNLSSGIFNRGNDGSERPEDKTKIEASGMFVNGQPFIRLTAGYFHALWESIGEPFEDVQSFPGYEDVAGNTEGGKSYLEKTSTLYSEIKKNQIELNIEEPLYDRENDIYTSTRVYTPTDARVAANSNLRKYSNTYLSNEDEALDFFYRGNSDVKLPTLTSINNGYDLADYIFAYYKEGQSIEEEAKAKKAYYSGADKDLGGKKEMYFKNYNPPDVHKYMGLRAYMVAKRSMFFGKFESAILKSLNFNQVIDLSQLQVSDPEQPWKYETPIHIFNGEDSDEITVNIDDYYIEEAEGVHKPYPTIIINKSLAPLTITRTNGKEFKGLIISQGNVKIEGEITLEGSIIIGEKTPENEVGFTARDKMMLGKDVGLGLSGDTTKVTIIHNPDMLLKMNVADKVLFRSILDALKITQFKNPPEDDEIDLADDAVELADDEANLAAILGPYNIGDIAYTQGRVKLSNQSILDITTEDIKVKIKTMKKVNE
jgi:hypothetical protein